MKHGLITRLAFAAMLAMAAPLSIALAASDAENLRTADGVRAVENHWARAFVTGDAAYLEHLLTNDYISVNQHGRPRTKAEIVALAIRIANGPNPPRPTDNTSTIAVHGDMALATTFAETDTSVDVFRYEGGRWRAWYSQHTSVTPPAPVAPPPAR